MTELFLEVADRAVAAGWLILAVLVLRLLLRRAPKWINLLLWALVALRLILPVAPESVLSLLPSGRTVPRDLLSAAAPAVHSGIALVDNVVNPMLEQTSAAQPVSGLSPLQVVIPVLALIWAAGVAVLAVHTAVSWLRLRRRVRQAVLLRDNIYQSEYVTSPFVLGLLRPKIYLPFSLGADTMGHVLAHEQAHIARRDHWWKPLSFALTAVYWFQPLMWVAYLLFCRDIELACDQRVVRTMDPMGRANYSQALLDCSTDRRPLGACPLAFGEAGVKTRVRAALHYKKPGFWVVLVAVLLCAGAAAAFLTNPVDAKEEPAQTADAFIADTLSSLTLGTDGTLSFIVPDPIPTLEDGAVQPFMTLSATFSDQAGSFSVQKLLDRAVDWQPGQTYSGMLDAQRGQLVGITFVVSLESEVEPGVYQQYAMDHLELTPPFPYDRPAGYTQPSVAVSAQGQTTDLLYTFSDGQQARLSLALPAGLEVGGQLQEDTGLPGLALLRDGQQVGTVLLYGLGATDQPTLAEVDTAAHALPMQIFAEVALSNHAGYEDYHVVTHSGTGAAATARYVWQELGTTDAAATDPWSSMDCVLAYDWSVMPCFVQLTLQTGVLDAAGLTALAERLTLTVG